MVSRRALLGMGVVTAGLATGGGVTALTYTNSIAQARSLVAPDLSKVVPTRFGDLE